MILAKLNPAMAAMSNKDTVVSDLCRELGITRQTLYRYVSVACKLLESGKKLLKAGCHRTGRHFALRLTVVIPSHFALCAPSPPSSIL